MPALLITFAVCLAVDGDTLRCGRDRIRLLKIDTPERHEAGYREAKEHLALLVEGRQVTCVVKARDRYGRMLGECSTPDTPSLGEAMLRSGMAVPYRRRR